MRSLSERGCYVVRLLFGPPTAPITVEQGLHLVEGFPRYVRKDVIDCVFKMPTGKKHVQTFGRRMFACADYGLCAQLHRIAPTSFDHRTCHHHSGASAIAFTSAAIRKRKIRVATISTMLALYRYWQQPALRWGIQTHEGPWSQKNHAARWLSHQRLK